MFYAKREIFFDILYIIFDKWSKIVQKNINVMRKWSTNASKVDGERSPLKFFLINILYRNSVTLEPDLFFSWSNSRWTIESEENHWSQSYLSVRRFCFLIFGMLSSFYYLKNCLRSHILHALQKASNIFGILFLKLMHV